MLIAYQIYKDYALFATDHECDTFVFYAQNHASFLGIIDCKFASSYSTISYALNAL